MKTNLSIILTSLILLTAAGERATAAVAIENEIYAVQIEAGEGSFTIASKAFGKTFLTDGKLSGKGGMAKAFTLSDQCFGKGTGIEISYPNGNRERVALYAGLPFVTFRSTFHNGGAGPVVLNHVPTVSAGVVLGRTLAELRTLGTGGLLEPAKNPGSYSFLTVIEPQNRDGVVAGWLTHDRGSGVVFLPVQAESVRLQAKLDYGRLHIKPGDNAVAETFALGYFEDARFGLEAYADAIAKIYDIKLPPQRPGYCTWYLE